MARRLRHADPFELLLRRGNLVQLLDFFTRLEERLTGAFARAARVLSDSDLPSAKQVRGSTRRHHLHQALLATATDVGLPVTTAWTEPATWSYPVLTVGGFRLTLGIVEARYRGDGKRLRTRSEYMKQLCARNEPLNPQGSLFGIADEEERVIPDGSLGGLIVAQYRPHQPDVPAFLGFWVPSEKLTVAYYVRSFDEIIAMIRERLSLARRPAKRTILRKPVVRRRTTKPKGQK